MILSWTSLTRCSRPRITAWRQLRVGQTTRTTQRNGAASCGLVVQKTSTMIGWVSNTANCSWVSSPTLANMCPTYSSSLSSSSLAPSSLVPSSRASSTHPFSPPRFEASSLTMLWSLPLSSLSHSTTPSTLQRPSLLSPQNLSQLGQTCATGGYP